MNVLLYRIIQIIWTEGSIVNILSTAVHCGARPIMAYSASKAALAILTKNVAHALRFDRIRVNGINMGWADTAGEHAVRIAEGEPDNWLELAEAKEPFRRLLRIDDIAKLTAYLLGNDAEMMTGSLIHFNQHVIGALD